MGKGYATSGSVLVNQTNDGVPLGVIWDEINSILDLYNGERSTLASLLSYPTTNVADAVSQAVNNEKFEPATEFGVPQGIAEPTYLKLGYGFRDYDLALRMTWLYARDASAEQIRNRVSRALAADNKLVNGTILNRLFSNTSYTNDFGQTVYGLWNADGMVPAPHAGNVFDGAHQHFFSTQSTSVDADDIEMAIHHIKEHGYGTTQAAQFLLLMNPSDVETSLITSWRAGVAYTTGKTPKWDFIPSSNAPAYLSNESVRGAAPPADFAGLPVTGSYGHALLIESYFIPAGWCAVVASGGANSEDNPIGFRHHQNPAYQGLRAIPGHWQDYPLIESFLARGFGVGVRHRSAAVALQISGAPTYTPPVIQT